MRLIRNKKRKLYITIVSTFVLILASFFIYNILVDYISLADTENNIWDGVTTSTSFSSGNGTEGNPYIISNGADLKYFKELIEGEDSALYRDKYYELGQDIDLGEKDFEAIGSSKETENIFSGTLNGNGYSIKNVNIISDADDNTRVYGLFTYLKDATITNIQVENLNIIPLGQEKYIVGSLAGKTLDNTVITNVSITNSRINTKSTKYIKDSGIGTLTYEIGNECIIKNIILDVHLESDFNNDIYNITKNHNSNLINIVVVNNNDFNKAEIVENKDIVFEITKNDGKLDVSEKTLNIINEDLTDYSWKLTDGKIVLSRKDSVLINGDMPTSFAFSTNTIPVHESGIDAANHTMYVNDLEADRNYYEGLNYTYSSNGKLPTLENKNTFDNLIEMHIQYNGQDLVGSNNIGYIGPTTAERISVINYYKYYQVVDNKVTIELIDNPFANRPGTLTFHGWLTAYDDVFIWYDEEIHTYYAEVDVTNKTGPISIVFNANWRTGKFITANTTSPNYSGLDDDGFKEIERGRPSGDLYIYVNSVSFFDDIPQNYYDINGNKSTSYNTITCYESTCPYYGKVAGTSYNPDNEYYQLVNGKMVLATGIGYDESLPSGGLYETYRISSGETATGLYDGYGKYISSTKCNQSSCLYYKRVQYLDENGEVNKFKNENNKKYYYLVTRDTNIMYLTTTITGLNVANQKKMTITSLNNGTRNSSGKINLYNDRNAVDRYNSKYIMANNDLRIEYTRVTANTRFQTGDPNGGNQATGYIYGNYHNLKIGRGIENTSNNYVTASNIMGGNNDRAKVGEINSPKRYKFVVESGRYNGMFSIKTDGNATIYVDAKTIYGNDYDRVNNDNNNLVHYYTASLSRHGQIYTGDGSTTSTKTLMKQIVKSGTIGSSKNDIQTGIYAGGLGNSSSKIYGVRELIVEGGKIFNIIGGPTSATSRKEVNDIFICVKGGEVDYIFGGAATTKTYGNRIISVTGGTVNYGVFGGSNGIKAGNGDGTLDAKTYVYIGGNAVIGNSTKQVSDTYEYGITRPAVHGIGNGRSGYDAIGTARESNIIINGGTIYGDVYGGGNYGALGTNSAIVSNNSTINTNIKILKGSIEGKVFGGGNQNGSGRDDITSNININIYGGEIKEGVYGGSNYSGTIYGPTTINVYDGQIGSIYGAGLGEDTVVRDKIRVNINDGTISKVYGGSSQGTANGTWIIKKAEYWWQEDSIVLAPNDKEGIDIEVNINGGTITDSVFAGAEGSPSTPNVYRDTTVNINGGSVANVYGGNDKMGQPSEESKVYLKGGTVGNVYGGGNNTGHNISNVYLQGSSVTNIFGGSNESGDVNNTNITMTSGTVGSIYGGNNAGGSAKTVKVDVSGGKINGDIYGGGKSAPVSDTLLGIKDVTTNNIFGGSEEANASKVTMNLNNVTTVAGKKIFGGSNKNGTVNSSTITANNVKASYMYGGNNIGGTTTDTHIIFNSGDIGTMYGGGEQASSTTSNIEINGGKVDTLYGGGNNAGLTTSNVNIYGGEVGSVFGGSNNSGKVETTNVKTKPKELLTTDISVQAKASEPWWMDTKDGEITYAKIQYTIINNTSEKITNWQAKINFTKDTRLWQNYSGPAFEEQDNVLIFNETDKYNNPHPLEPNGGMYTFEIEVLSTAEISDFATSVDIIDPVPNLYVTNVYGGGNKANVGKTNVQINNSTLNTVYGGGNAAQVEGNTYLDVNNSKVVYLKDSDGKNVGGNIFGGGNLGAVTGNTEVYITDTSIEGNLYAGGNGMQANVKGNSTLDIDGKTIVGKEGCKAPYAGSVFGGGNQASTGEEGKNTSKTTVNIAGAQIFGNVYGGANTSVIYGSTEVNLGYESVTNKDLTEDDIVVKGTIFGGGETDPEADEDKVNYQYLSVIGTIDIMLDGTNYKEHNHRFETYGSIFGSGHASTSKGTSTTYVKKLGTPDKPSPNISFQRINYLTIDNSVMELEGIENSRDTTNPVKYSFYTIDSLIIKNNTTILMQSNSGLLKSFYSGTDESGTLIPATVDIDENGNTTKNVDNRVYLLANENMNISTVPNGDAGFGPVTGMTFFGMYTKNISGVYQYGIYDRSFENGTPATAANQILGSSIIRGLHAQNHDITVDGFYTNSIHDNDEFVTTEYINPTPPDQNFYRWIIGTAIKNYKINLVASKYSSVGAKPVLLEDFGSGNVEFEVIGLNIEGLVDGVKLLDSANIPKLSTSASLANRELGLAMKAETREWTSYGTTKMLSAGGGSFSGSTNYLTDSNVGAPSLMFYLYHAKNITLKEELGTVVVAMRALTRRNEIEYSAETFTITIDISSAVPPDGNNYDASLTYDKKYEMPSSTPVNVTNRSQFTAYYSLFATVDGFYDVYGVNNNYHHALVSTYALPVGTQITMIDYAYEDGIPNYYYFNITEEVYDKTVQQIATRKEATYELRDFIKMGSTSSTNKYDEKAANLKYYNDTYNIATEEFIFIIDLKETTMNGVHSNNNLFFELRDDDENTIIYVANSREEFAKYSLYDSTNAVLEENVNMSDYMYYDIITSIGYSTNIAYDKTGNADVIIDTNYESSSMGLNVYVYDSSGNQVSSSLLTGTNIKLEGREYFADGDGVYRIKLANKVSNIVRNLELIPNKILPEGRYTFRFVLFASDDGLHNSTFDNVATYDKQITLVGSDNALVVTGEDYNKVVDGSTGLNQNKTNRNRYKITLHSVFNDPNVRLSVYKRDTVAENSTEYQEIPIGNLFGNLLYTVESKNYKSKYQYERMLEVKENEDNQLDLNLIENLKSGTYKLVFKLYDGNQLIEEDVEYVIVSKKIETPNNKE